MSGESEETDKFVDARYMAEFNAIVGGSKDGLIKFYDAENFNPKILNPEKDWTFGLAKRRLRDLRDIKKF